MLARLQRCITLALLATAGAWLVYFLVQGQPVLAWSGCALLLFGHAAVLGVEFCISRHISRNDATGPANLPELLRAWSGECREAPLVFCWQQPFRAGAIPDHLGPPARVAGHRGVVFIHGLFCNRGFWNPWLRALEGGHHAFAAVSLEPVFGSIDNYVTQIEDAVRRVTHATGMPPLLVCHSMGGLAARAWLRHMGAADRVYRVVTIGTPHHGTWLARFGHTENSRQMRPLSSWFQQLDGGQPANQHAGHAVGFTCWYSNCDNIVFPVSNATLPGASNRLVRAAGHVQLAFMPEVMAQTLALLQPGGVAPAP